MAKKTQKPELPAELFIYRDRWGNGPEDETLIAAESIEETVGSDDSERVGVYQLVKIVTVKGEKKVTVE